MPRLVRKAPLSERIKAYLDPYDFLLWVSEELHESAVDDALKEWAVPIGGFANLIILIARANSQRGRSSGSDSVFGEYDGRGGSNWLSWFVRTSNAVSHSFPS